MLCRWRRKELMPSTNGGKRREVRAGLRMIDARRASIAIFSTTDATAHGQEIIIDSGRFTPCPHPGTLAPFPALINSTAHHPITPPPFPFLLTTSHVRACTRHRNAELVPSLYACCWRGGTVQCDLPSLERSGTVRAGSVGHEQVWHR